MTARTYSDLPPYSRVTLGAHLARNYYDGMHSALYALTSTGSLELYPGEGLARIIREVFDAVQAAERDYPEDAEPLRAFLHWLEDRHAEDLRAEKWLTYGTAALRREVQS